MKTIKVNNTGKQASPEFLFSGKEKPTHEQWMQIVDLFEKHFEFIGVFSFNPEIAYKPYHWQSKPYSNGNCLELKPGHISDRISLTMVLAILQKLHDLPDFVSIVED